MNTVHSIEHGNRANVFDAKGLGVNALMGDAQDITGKALPTREQLTPLPTYRESLLSNQFFFFISFFDFCGFACVRLCCMVLFWLCPAFGFVYID